MHIGKVNSDLETASKLPKIQLNLKQIKYIMKMTNERYILLTSMTD